MRPHPAVILLTDQNQVLLKLNKQGQEHMTSHSGIIPDIHFFYANDPRVIGQFRGAGVRG